VTSDDGGGKSSLVAHFCRVIRDSDPKSVVVPYFVGLSESSEAGRLLHSILKSLKRDLHLSRDLPSTENRYDEVISGFASWLEYAARESGRNITIIIDSIDKATHASNNYTWFPREFPKDVKVILSCSPGSDAFRLFSERLWTSVIPIRPVTPPPSSLSILI